MNGAEERFAVPFVKALIIFPGQGRFLLQRRAKERDPYVGYWELPGGKIRHDETVEDALRREIAEEAGLRLVRVFGRTDHLSDSLGRIARRLDPLVTVEVAAGPVRMIGHYFACLTEGTPSPSAEGEEHRLVTPDEFREEFLGAGSAGASAGAPGGASATGVSAPAGEPAGVLAGAPAGPSPGVSLGASSGGSRCATLDLLALRICLGEGKLEEFLQAP